MHGMLCFPHILPCCETETMLSVNLEIITILSSFSLSLSLPAVAAGQGHSQSGCSGPHCEACTVWGMKLSRVNLLTSSLPASLPFKRESDLWAPPHYQDCVLLPFLQHSVKFLLNSYNVEQSRESRKTFLFLLFKYTTANAQFNSLMLLMSCG